MGRCGPGCSRLLQHIGTVLHSSVARVCSGQGLHGVAQYWPRGLQGPCGAQPRSARALPKQNKPSPALSTDGSLEQVKEGPELNIHQPEEVLQVRRGMLIAALTCVGGAWQFDRSQRCACGATGKLPHLLTPPAALQGMNEWCVEQHGKSGLTQVQPRRAALARLAHAGWRRVGPLSCVHRL